MDFLLWCTESCHVFDKIVLVRQRGTTHSSWKIEQFCSLKFPSRVYCFRNKWNERSTLVARAHVLVALSLSLSPLPFHRCTTKDWVRQKRAIRTSVRAIRTSVYLSVSFISNTKRRSKKLPRTKLFSFFTRNVIPHV